VKSTRQVGSQCLGGSSQDWEMGNKGGPWLSCRVGGAPGNRKVQTASEKKGSAGEGRFGARKVQEDRTKCKKSQGRKNVQLLATG